jgi:hypothetical protein
LALRAANDKAVEGRSNPSAPLPSAANAQQDEVRIPTGLWVNWSTALTGQFGSNTPSEARRLGRPVASGYLSS